MITKKQLLAKIKEYIDGNPFIEPGIYDKFKDLEEERLNKILVMLYSIEQKRAKEGDDNIRKGFEELNKQAKKITKDETLKFLKAEEQKSHAKEQKAAEKDFEEITKL